MTPAPGSRSPGRPGPTPAARLLDPAGHPERDRTRLLTLKGGAVRRQFMTTVAAGLGVALPFSLSACADDADSLHSGLTIKLIATEYGNGPENSTKRYWDELVTEFEAKNPGTRVSVEVYSRSEVDRKVASLVKAGTAPDLAQAGSYGEYAAEGRLYKVRNLLSVPTEASFIPALTDGGEMSGTRYAMPFAASTRVLFYNKDLLERAGISDPPKTWKQLAEDASALQRAGVRIPYGLPLGAEEAQAETLNWLLSGGGGYTNDTGSYAFDSAENVYTFEWLKAQLVDKGLTQPDPLGTNRQDAYDAFTRGEVAMLNGHPTLMEQARKKGISFGMAPLPGRNGPSRAATGTVDWMMAFNQNGKRKEVGDFLDFVYTKKNDLKFADRYDLLPVTWEATEEMQSGGANKEMRQFFDQLSGAEFYPVGKKSWGPIVARLRSLIGWALAKDSNPKELLYGLQNEASRMETGAS